MNVSAGAMTLEMAGPAVERALSQTAGRRFLVWTLCWWGGVGVCAALFYLGVLDFPVSAKVSLYGISIWLNGWLLACLGRKDAGRLRPRRTVGASLRRMRQGLVVCWA